MSENGFTAIREAMDSGIKNALIAIYIFFLIGILIASFVQSGTVASLIYYSIQLISPSIFLPVSFLICCLMSLATGSSWGTAGTIGVVLMSIGQTLGIPLPLVAGLVISGACFGDKMSPVSDTTNLASLSADTNIYQHIKSMCYTTIPTFFICIIIYSFLSLRYANITLDVDELNMILNGIGGHFKVSLICLLPFALMIVMSFSRASAEVSMITVTFSAVLIALFYQGAELSAVLNALQDGEVFETGVSSLDALFKLGGIKSMMWTLSVALLALALGGILNSFGFLRVLIMGVLVRVKRAASVIACSIITCIIGNAATSEQYITIILGGQLFSDAYDDHGIDRSVLSRSLEEGGTLTSSLIPWTTCGAYYASVLGISTIEYLPWVFFNIISPLMGITFAYLGIALFKANPKDIDKRRQNILVDQV